MANSQHELMRKLRWNIWDDVLEQMKKELPAYEDMNKDDQLKLLIEPLGTKSHTQFYEYGQGSEVVPRIPTIQRWLKFLGKTIEDYDEQAVKEKPGRGHDKVSIKSDPFLRTVKEFLSRGKLLSSYGPDSQLDTSEENLLFLLISNLKRHYTQNTQFISIGLLADKEGHFGYLSMDDQFIQLSYISLEEARKRNSANISEAELNRTKINRSVANNLKLSRDYVINYHFQDVQQLLILGSPGIGKSTFSRWHCYEWTKDPKRIEKIPVYIELRALNFNTNTNPISDYISKQYGTEQITPHAWSNLLCKAAPVLCFVLDGYDELTEENKRKLTGALSDFSQHCKYMLTSRPYGALNTHGLSITDSIQLDGLDMSGINTYIDNFLDKDGPSAKKALLRIIDANPTLSDFAHNPLMLSFMVIIYLSDNAAERTLGGVQSRFDLQNMVMRWMTSHSAVDVSDELENKAAVLAYDMELEKDFEQVETQRVGLRDTFREMSKAGIGQIADSGRSGYKFYFNSLSFQEYFAARAIIDKITPAGLNYLLKDSYFWNLCAMIAGGLKDQEILIGAIKLCEQNVRTTYKHNGYEHYKYILLLSECSTLFLRDFITEEHLAIAYEGYRMNMQYDVSIATAMGECISRLYKKLGMAQQQAFKTLMIKAFVEYTIKEWEDEDEYAAWNENYSHLPLLISSIGLEEDTRFCIDISDVLLTLLKEGEEGDQEGADLFDVLFDIISKRRIGEHKVDAVLLSRFREISELLSDDYIIQKAELAVHDADAFTQNMQLLKRTQELIGGKQKEKHIGEIVIALFVVTKHNAASRRSIVDKSQENLIRKTFSIVIRHLHELKDGEDDQTSDHNLYYYRDLSYLVAIALFEWGIDDTIKQGLQLLEINEDMEVAEFEPFDAAAISSYFEQLIGEGLTAGNMENFKYLLMLIQHFPLLKNKIAFSRTAIASQVAGYIRNNESTLQHYDTISISYIGSPKGEADEGMDAADILTPFFDLLRSDDYKIYESDKHYFLHYLLENGLGEHAYFRKFVIRHVFSDRINIYDDLYWKHILECLNSQDQQVVANALFVCTNITIYNYTANLQWLKDILTLLCDKLSAGELPQESLQDVLFIVAHTLLMIKRNDLNDVLASNIVSLTGRLLQRKDIYELTVKKGMRSWFGSQQAAYILQRYQTNDKTFDLGLNYLKKMKGNELGIDNLLFDLHLALFRNGVLSQGDAMFIGKIGGKELQERLSDMTDDFIFSKKEFERLL